MLAMRKKRMAFAKTSFFMASVSMFLIDGPSTMCILPLLLGSGWTALKMGTQISFKLTPERFTIPRTLDFPLNVQHHIFNLNMGKGINSKLLLQKTKKRREKVELEYSFF